MSAVIFTAASSVVWLFAARALQGLATGAALGAAGAALIDLHPTSETRIAALVNGVVALGGLGVGALRHLSAAIPPDRRAEVMSAFYVVGYLSLALPAVAAGIVASAVACLRRLRSSAPPSS